jgi:hypothetical protein
MAQHRDRFWSPQQYGAGRNDREEDIRDSFEDEDEEMTGLEGEEELEEDELLDEEREFTGEIGSEGGSRGDIQRGRGQAGVSRGSDATEIGRPSGDKTRRRERKAGDW